MDNKNVSKQDENIVEVSLPGVGDNEQPTILEVLNRGIVDTKEEIVTVTGTESTNNIVAEEEVEDVSLNSTIKVTSELEAPQKKKQEEEEEPQENDKESDILVIRNSSSGSQSKWNEPPQRKSQLSEDELQDECGVYDIESHLIETLKNYSVSEDSGTWGVDIKELPPIEGESLHRTSKIETDPSIGSVIEVEPASPKVLKPVKISVPEPQRQSVFVQKESQKEQNSSELKLNKQTNEDTNSEVAQNITETDSFRIKEHLLAQNSFETESSELEECSGELPDEFEFNSTDLKAHLSESQFDDQPIEYSILSTGESTPVIVTDLDSDESVDEVLSESKEPENHSLRHKEEQILDYLSSKVDINQNFNVLHQNNCNILNNKTEQKLDLTEEPIVSSSREETTTSLSNRESTDTTQTKIEPTAPDPVAEVEPTSESSSSEVTIKSAIENAKTEDSASLTKEIDQKLSELSTHLSSNSKVDLNGNISKSEAEKLTGESLKEGFDINGLPLPRTAAEEEQRKEFLDSLPQVSLETDSNKVAALAKREYYQSLRQYLITHVDRPPVPPETYRWEDLKRAKQRGGYPWTHLHKRPLGPDEEPEIVLLLRKSQELRFTSESPKSFKKVRIDDQVSIKETERYIQELSDTEENSHTEDEADEEEEEHGDERSECISCVSDSVLTVEKKASKLGKLRGILKKRSPKKEPDSKSLPDTSTVPSTSFTSNNKSAEDVRERPSRLRKEEHHHKAKCFPIMKKLKSMADRQKKNFKNIKKISLKKDEKIPLDEEQKIIRLKTSPKAVHSEIPHFIEKQDSDDVLEIIELDESPSRKRKDQLELQEQASAESSVLVPDEIIDIPTTVEDDFSERQQTPEPTVSEILEEELKSSPVFSGPPKKAARLRREHVYEDIEDTGESVSEEINTILQIASVEALKQSLSNQDNSTLKDMEATKTDLPLEHMGSSEEEVEHPKSFLAPLSSIDSASSEEERKPHLSPVAEESDAASVDGVVVAATAAAVAVTDKEAVNNNKLQVATEGAKERITEHLPWADIELKPVLKKEASPAPSEKKVTFSHVEDEAEPHREDIELPEELRGTGPKRWSNLSDHEYEPIGEPSTEIQKESTPEPPAQVSALKKEPSPAPPSAVPQAQADHQEISHSEVQKPTLDASDETPSKSDELKEAEELQKDLEDRYFNSAPTTSQQESQNDYEMQTSQMDSSALDDIPMEAENKKKGFMANAQDKTRKMQAGLKNQAGKIKTKFRSQKKAPSGSPKAANRKRFKAPEFSKIKMPEMKRPEFTKFSKPDMSKFKLPDKFSSLKLTRSKSFKEPSEMDDTTVSGTTPESAAATAPPKKQRFDFSFGTYPRAFRKKSKPQVVEESTVDEPSVIQSTETQPSAESSSTPQGDRGPGPVRSRWADKFSDVSYNDSEGSRYRRFESEQDSSFDRESSMERRMKEVLEDNAKEEAELAMLGVVEQKQFADYDEENRVIHEISKIREREFKRRPMVHQDSDLVSEEGRDIGWTQREAEKNQFLRKAELEAESHLKHHTEKEYHPDTQSTASSKRLVFEEIGSDEFLLRKKGASQEFSIGKQKYLDPNLETEYDKSPNPLELIGSQTASLNGSSIDRIDYGYDVPPPKPRRLSQQQRQRPRYDSENASQIDDYADNISLSQAGSDYFRHAPPARPLRKGRFKNSQDMSIEGTPSIQYDEDDYSLRNKNFVEEEKENIHEEQRNESPMLPQQPPQPPRRRRKQLRDSLEKDSYVNGFGGRSVSNSYLREDNKPEEVIVYRTEHEYNIPLATPENYTDTSVTTRKSKSLSRLGIDDDDRTSHGADSLTLDIAMREENENKNLNAEELHEKYIIEMMENDGYAVVRKENLPKPTPPARRKKFTRSPGERFATMPHQRKASPSLVAEQKISTGNYSTIGRPTPPRRRSATSLTAVSQKDYGSQDFTDYEEPDLDERPESPRNLQSGDIINKMKYRPLPPPPRPPREKRHFHRDRNGGDDNDDIESRDDRDDRDGGGERIAYHELHEQSSDDYNQQQDNVEVEVSTQTDPLPDDFVCEEFEITEDMKIIEPRRTKTLDEILKEEEEAELERSKQIDEEILARGIQRFREASQRSASDRSRASSQAKSLSRPQTPSAILIEKRIPTPVPNANGQTVIEASLTVQPIDDLDLEEEILRREGLYDGSHSKSDEESRYKEEEKRSSRAASEEENARVDEEVQSYTRSSDVESQHQEEEERERERELEMERQRDQEIAFEAERRLREEEEKQKRLQEEEEEEANRRLQEEVEADERLLRELEEEQRYLEEALLRHAEKEKELERRIREEEEEEERKRILEEIAIDQRLRPDSQSEEHESYDEDQNERLKSEDSYELKSEVSEEKETTPLPSPSSTQQPPQVEQEVLVSQVKKLLLTTPPKEESQEREKTLSPPPTAPPRKRSTADHTESLSVAEQPAPIPFTGVMPSHLSIADLEVERLRVHALQAGQIMVSHLHGAQIQAEELECRSGNLVVKNIELPPGFIEDIVERVRSTEREHAQASTQTIAEARTQTETNSIPPPPLPSREPEVPPVRPPPPSAAHFLQLQHDQDESPRSVHLTDYHLQTIPPIGFYNHLHAGDDGEPAAGPPPVYRRRRHLRRRDSSSEEEHQRRRSRSIRPEQPPQSVAQAGRQFISACSLPLVNIITQLTNALRPNNDNNKDQVQPRNISTAVVLLVVMALSFVIYLLTGRNIHHHHWDYFNPPGNDGRLS